MHSLSLFQGEEAVNAFNAFKITLVIAQGTTHVVKKSNAVNLVPYVPSRLAYTLRHALGTIQNVVIHS